MIWNIDPILLELGPLEIRYYGLFFALSLFFGYMLARKMCSIKKLSLDTLDSLIFHLVLGLIIGARFGHILFYELDFYLSNLAEILQIWNGGLSSHGAALGLIAAYAFFLWRNKKVKFFDHADIISIVAAFPIIFVRLGNFFNSEILGRPWDGPWAITFNRIDEIPRHPTVLYEALLGLIVLAILYSLWLKKHRTAKPGFFLGLFFMIYFGGRFLTEFTKELAIHENLLGLTTGQLLSIPFALIGIYLVIKKSK